MKFKISSSSWCESLNFVMHAIPQMGRVEKAWSSGMYVEAFGNETDGKVVISGTDIRQIGMRIEVPAAVEREGRGLFTSQLHALFQLLVNDGDMFIDYDEADKNVNIQTDYYNGNFPCLDETEFMVLGLEDEPTNESRTFSLPMRNLQQIVETVAPSADLKDVDSGKAGVLFRCEQAISEPIPGEEISERIGAKMREVAYPEIPVSPSRLVTVALDNKKLSKYEVCGLLDDVDDEAFAVKEEALRPFEKIPHFEMMVPAGLIQTSYKALNQLTTVDADVTVSMFGGFITLKRGIASIALRLLAHELPNWRRVIANPIECSLILSVEELKLASQVASLSNLTKKDAPIVIYLSDGNVKLGNGVLDDDKSAREIKTVYDTSGDLPKEHKIGIKYENFSNVLNYIKTDQVCLRFYKNALKPIFMNNCRVEAGKDGDKPTYIVEEDFLGMVMPIALKR